MTKQFLMSLAGQPLLSAVLRCQELGYAALPVNTSEALSALARPSTVVLWVANGYVEEATAGDPCELEQCNAETDLVQRR